MLKNIVRRIKRDCYVLDEDLTRTRFGRWPFSELEGHGWPLEDECFVRHSWKDYCKTREVFAE